MPNTFDCKVCKELTAEHLAEANRQLSAGIPTKDIAAKLTGLGYSITARNLANHNRHVPAVPVMPLVPSVTVSMAPIDAEGISSQEAMIRVIRASLEQSERLASFCRGNLSLRTERVLGEVLASTFKMLAEVSYSPEDIS